MSYQAKQISDKEKIEIMQHYLDGGEVEYREFDEKDWCVVKPSWAWNDCFYRKRVLSEELSAIQKLQEQFQTGNYICVGERWFGVSDWSIIEHPTFNELYNFTSDIINYKLIHKKHGWVLEAYLKDSNSVIEWNPTGFGFTYLEEDFLETYNEINNYRLKPKESQIVYECFRTDKKTGESEICTKLLTDNMLKMLLDEDRTQYTYHKTGRSFEIKLGDK